MNAKDPTAGKGEAGVVPNLEARTAVGVFDRAEDADRGARALQAQGFAADDISVVCKGSDSAPPVGAEETKSGAGTAAGASAGAVIGGLAALAALAIPGIGPLVAVGPLAAALGGAAAGGALGGLVGSFAGLGIPTDHAERYEAAIRSGGIFVAVKTADEAAADRAGGVLKQHGARLVSSYTPAL
jgi:hypothetical protein